MRPFFDESRAFYWLIKGRIDQGIPENPRLEQTFVVTKKAIFHYPIGQVLLVCNDDFEALMYAKILDYSQADELTKVTCQVVRLLAEAEQSALTLHLQTTASLCQSA